MNKWIGIGRLTNEPLVTFSQNQTKIAKYTLAVDGYKNVTDFIRCVAYDKSADFAENFLHKGMKVAVTAHVKTGSYDNKDGKKVYTADMIIETQEFCEKKADAPAEAPKESASIPTDAEGFMNIPDNIDEELPFN